MLSKVAYFPSENNIHSGIGKNIYHKPNAIPVKTDRKKEALGALIFQNRNTGASPKTMVPLIVVASKISGLKNMGMVPKTAMSIMVTLALETEIPLSFNKSTCTSLAAEVNVESIVEAAEVSMMVFIRSNIGKPKSLDTANITGADMFF